MYAKEVETREEIKITWEIKIKKNKKKHTTSYSLAVTKGHGQGFPPATTSIILAYFHREQKENGTKGTYWPFNSPPTNWIYPAM